MDKESAPQKAYARAIDYKRTFSTASGKKVLHDLMDHCFILRGMNDPVKDESARKVALRILSILNTDVESLKKQIEENEKHANQRDYKFNVI